MIDRLSAAAIAALAWSIPTGFAAKRLLMEHWGFDPTAGAHWRYLGNLIVEIWYGRNAILWDFAAGLLAAALAVLGGGAALAVLAWRHPATAAAPLRLMLLPIRGLGSRFRRRAETAEPEAPTAPPRETVDPDPGEEDGEEPEDVPDEPFPEQVIDLTGDLEEDEAAAPAETPEEDPPREEEEENPPMHDGPHVEDLRGSVMLWLKDRGWETRLEFHVNGDGAQVNPFPGDAYDEDPHAVIPLAAFSAGEVWLVHIADLEGKTWTPVPHDPLRRGVPAWTAEDGAADDCPVSLALRAHDRFIAHFGAVLEEYGMQARSLVVLGNGDLDDTEELNDSLVDLDGLVQLVFATTEDMSPLEHVFGTEPPDPIERSLLHALQSASLEAARAAA